MNGARLRRLGLPALLLAAGAGCGPAAPTTESGGTAGTPARPQAAEGAPASSPSGPASPRAGFLPDVAAAAGIDFLHVHGGHGKKFLFETMGSGLAATDLDGDGRMDLLLLQSGTLPADEFTPEELERAGHSAGETARLYLGEGDWRFRDATPGSGLDTPLYAMGCAAGDVDGDGDRDLYVAAYGRSRLYRNDGKARFTDERGCGIADPPWTIGGAFFDADLDGDLDLYSVAYLDMPIASHRFCGPDPERRSYCHVDTWPGLDDGLWINDGSGRFADGREAAGLSGTRGKGLAVVTADLDDDGDAEVFVANDSQANLLLRNDGGRRFTDVARRSGVDLNGAGRTEACMGTDAGDLDGDGDLDLYVVNYQAETNTLYRNDGGLFFTDVSTTSGAGPPSLDRLGFGCVFLDVENDGDLDIYVANGHIMDNVQEVEHISSWPQPDQLYLNDGRGRFTLAPDDWGPSLSVPRVGRGLVRADFDGDGDEDLAVNNGSGHPWLLRNDIADGHRVVLRLHGPGGRADAEGARVRLQAGGRLIVREIVGGGSYASQSDTSSLVIGLGDATRIDQLELRWPGGPTRTWADLPADRRYEFAFGAEQPSSTPLPPPAAPAGKADDGR